MQYLLNGGRNERGVLVYPEVRQLYERLGIKRVLFVVYALIEEYWQSSWHEASSLISIPGMELKSLTMYDTDSDYIADCLAWADFIYFPGGSQRVLLTRMQQLGTNKLLDTVVHNRAGQLKLLGGGSAGAMIMGSKCIVGHSIVKEVVPGLNYLEGYIIDSHFTERDRLGRLQAVLDGERGIKGMGIDEDTAVLFDDGLTPRAIYGPGTVTICDTTITIYDTHNITSRQQH